MRRDRNRALPCVRVRTPSSAESRNRSCETSADGWWSTRTRGRWVREIGSNPASRSHHEHAFARRVGGKQTVCLVGLVQFPAMGEQAVDVDLAVEDEARAFRLADRGKGPGSDE